LYQGLHVSVDFFRRLRSPFQLAFWRLQRKLAKPLMVLPTQTGAFVIVKTGAFAVVFLTGATRGVASG
jgi:hypothetical protein